MVNFNPWNILPYPMMGGLFSKQAVLCVSLAILASSQAILATLSKNKEGSYDYDTSSISLVAESLKLVLSLFFLISDLMSMDRVDSTSVVNALPMPNYGIPYLMLGVLYAIQNNAIYFVMMYLSPGTFQVLASLKLLLIAFLLKMLQNKQYSKEQIIGLAFLTLGATLPRIPEFYSGSDQSELSGYIVASAMICISAFASVINEILLKNKTIGSLHWQNSQLYTWGSLFCLLNTKRNYQGSMITLFHGYNLIAALNVINLSSLGLMTSFLLKYSNNIVRSISGILSIYFSILISFLFFDSRVSAYDVLGAGFVGIGIAFYSKLFGLNMLKI